MLAAICSGLRHVKNSKTPQELMFMQPAADVKKRDSLLFWMCG